MQPDEEFDFFEELMQNGPSPQDAKLELSNQPSMSFIRRGDNDLADYGMVAHQGILHPEEYVDEVEMSECLKKYLGVSLESVQWAYGGGRPDPARLKLRNRLDEVFLHLHEEGANMSMLGACLGFTVTKAPNGSTKCRVMQKALKRAKKLRANGTR